VNRYWGTRVVTSEKLGRPISVTYVTHAGKAYQELIAKTLLEMGAWYRSANPLLLRLLICPDSERQQDIDNRCKVAIDSLMNGNLFLDDSQIETLEVRRGPTIRPAVMFVWAEEFVPDRRENLAWIKNGDPSLSPSDRPSATNMSGTPTPVA